MNVIIAISIVVLAIGASFIQLNSEGTVNGIHDSSEVTQGTPTIRMQTPTPRLAYPTNTPHPTEVIPTNTPHPTTQSLSYTYIYPGATTSSQSEHRITLTSTDSPDTITDWYKAYITSKNMNTTSFVSTNTNDTILNKLVAAGNGETITVTITRNPNSSTTTIEIEQ